MPQSTYAYKVRDGQGKLVEGTLEADNQGLVATRLRQMGYVPIEIAAKSGGASGTMKKDLHLPGMGDRVPLKALAMFSRQFATLINSGLTLIRALTIMEEQTEHPVLRKALAEVKLQVERGVSLSEALRGYPKTFGRLYIAMVRAGETSGSLDGALLSLAENLEKQVTLRGKIKSAMAYPVTAMGIVILISAAILLFIVPQFKSIYATLGGTLPKPTLILVDISNIVVKYFPLVVILLIIAVVALRKFIKTERGRIMWDTLRLNIPIFGALMRKTALSRFSSTLSSLLRAGVPVLEALEITRETVGNVVVARGVDSVIAAVKSGEPIAHGLHGHTVFPTMVTHMISVGEETGSLDDMLGKSANFLDGEIERTVDALTSLLEPLMIVVLGGAVGAMVICLYLPMFNVDKLVNSGGSS